MRVRLIAVLLSLVLSVVTLVVPASTAEAASLAPRLKAVQIALNKRGAPYVYGAEGPFRFDCSGLVYFVERKAGHRHTPRTAQQQYRFLRHIPLRRLQRGDLIFYHDAYGNVFHVAIYLGHGRVVEAARPGAGVRVAPVWQVPRYAATFRRRT